MRTPQTRIQRKTNRARARIKARTFRRKSKTRLFYVIHIRHLNPARQFSICSDFQPGMLIGDESSAVWFWTFKPFVLRKRHILWELDFFPEPWPPVDRRCAHRPSRWTRTHSMRHVCRCHATRKAFPGMKQIFAKSWTNRATGKRTQADICSWRKNSSTSCLIWKKKPCEFQHWANNVCEPRFGRRTWYFRPKDAWLWSEFTKVIARMSHTFALLLKSF